MKSHGFGVFFFWGGGGVALCQSGGLSLRGLWPTRDSPQGMDTLRDGGPGGLPPRPGVPLRDHSLQGTHLGCMRDILRHYGLCGSRKRQGAVGGHVYLLTPMSWAECCLREGMEMD